MSMIISQEYMENYVINPLARRLAEIEAKIDKLISILILTDENKPEETIKSIQISKIKKVKYNGSMGMEKN